MNTWGEPVVYKDACPYLAHPGSTCDFMTDFTVPNSLYSQPTCTGSSVPCNTPISTTSRNGILADALLQDSLYFAPAVGGTTFNGGPTHGPGRPFGGGFDSYQFKLATS